MEYLEGEEKAVVDLVDSAEGVQDAGVEYGEKAKEGRKRDWRRVRRHQRAKDLSEKGRDAVRVSVFVAPTQIPHVTPVAFSTLRQILVSPAGQQVRQALLRQIETDLLASLPLHDEAD